MGTGVAAKVASQAEGTKIAGGHAGVGGVCQVFSSLKAFISNLCDTRSTKNVQKTVEVSIGHRFAPEL